MRKKTKTNEAIGATNVRKGIRIEQTVRIALTTVVPAFSKEPGRMSRN